MDSMGSVDSRRRFVEAFFKDRGLPHRDIRLIPLEGDGSVRLFTRIVSSASHQTFILMENPPGTDYAKKENSAYLRIGNHLIKKGLPIPTIYCYELQHGRFILEDMGDTNLQSMASHMTNRANLYERIIDILFRLQIEGAQGFDTGWCCQTPTYDKYVMRHFEADYFMDSFLSNYLGMKTEWTEIDTLFDYLASVASMADNHHFLHRDFQSRNIMISDNRIGVLDWQGGRLGPLPYDLASLLIDPYTGLSEDEKDQICEQYLLLLKSYRPQWVEPFRKFFPYLAIQRNLQILGAFSFLTRVRGKVYFERFIPRALKSLFSLLERLGDSRLLPLKDLIGSVLSMNLKKP